jgi:hypothetical protein
VTLAGFIGRKMAVILIQVCIVPLPTLLLTISDTGEKIRNDEFKSSVGCSGALDITLAYTWNPLPQKPSQIQICPWFLQWVQGQRYGKWSIVAVKARIFDWLLTKITKGWPFTPIDAALLLDTTLLHKMTHTRVGKFAVDVCILRFIVNGNYLTTTSGRTAW